MHKLTAKHVNGIWSCNSVNVKIIGFFNELIPGIYTIAIIIIIIISSSSSSSSIGFLDTQYIDYIASNRRLIDEWTGRDMEGSDRVLNEMLSWKFPVWTEENHRISQPASNRVLRERHFNPLGIDIYKGQ
jgi:hypothetical protein